MTTDEVIVPTCQSCLATINQREVIAFGNALFHIECFKCAKCKKSVNNKDNLLVLNDGKPLCDQCSYQCSACHQNIQNEAILTDDHAYHADCFKCSSCHCLIQNLIFLQTEKGIYCADCQNVHKPKVNKKYHKSADDDKEVQIEPEATFSNGSLPLKGASSDHLFSDLTLSFFENDSSDLSNLSNSLGANLQLNMFDTNKSYLRESTIITQSRLNRASDILEKSLRKTSVIFSNNSQNDNTAILSTSDAEKLKKDLADSQSKIQELEANYKLLQDASQQALIEFNKIKEDYTKESKLKQKLEYSMIVLLKRHSNLISKNELNELASLKIDLEHTCKELAENRDKIAMEIQQNIDKNIIISDYQYQLDTQINSLIKERDCLKLQTNELELTRDEIISEIVVLNTKNTELTSIHNHLSKRALDRAKRADIPQNSPPLSPSQSTESTSLQIPRRTRKPSDAGSVLSFSSKLSTDQQSTFTRTLKKKGSSMFSKFTGTKKIEPSPSMVRIPTQQSIYSNQNFSSSVQSVQLDGRLGDKKFMESTFSFSENECMHAFQPYSFLRPVKCGVCLEKMWGRSEYRCEHCGMMAHSRCLNKMTVENFHDLEQPSASFMQPSLSTCSVDSRSKKVSMETPLFGNNLSDRCLFEQRSIPLIVEACIKEVELRGLDYEGIYRKSGGAAQTRTIQLAFERGKNIQLSDQNEFNDICAITSALKQYFRELSDPLLTFEAYDQYIKLSVLKNDEKKLQSFTETLSKLPKAHYDTMSYLFKHLTRVVENASLNRMTVKNLAMVFAPTLMRHADPSKDFLDISYKNATIEYILSNTGALFP